jgi:hypothetical protein
VLVVIAFGSRRAHAASVRDRRRGSPRIDRYGFANGGLVLCAFDSGRHGFARCRWYICGVARRPLLQYEHDHHDGKHGRKNAEYDRSHTQLHCAFRWCAEHRGFGGSYQWRGRGRA